MTERHPERPESGADVREDRRMLLGTAAAASGTFALASVLQAAYIFAAVAPGWSAVEVWSRVDANLLGVAALVGTLVAWRQHRRQRPADRWVGVLLAAAVGALVRALAQVPLGVYPGLARDTTTAELVSGFVVGIVSTGFATWAMLSRRRSRNQARANERLAVERALAVRALEDEEVRVRRDVAEGLHASVQQRLVLAVAQVAEVGRRLRAGIAGVPDAVTLDGVCATLDRVRDEDVRGMSRLLYPDQLEVGLVPAVRTMLRRVPTSVATHLDVDPAVRALDDPVSLGFGRTERLLAVRVVEEGIANALRHTQPTTLSVSLTLDGGALTVLVEDDGGGLGGGATRSGTSRLAERLSVVGGTLELVDITGDGTRLTGRVPLGAAVRA